MSPSKFLLTLLSVFLLVVWFGCSKSSSPTQTETDPAKAAERVNQANQIFIPRLVVAESGNTKIAPTEAEPPHPFTIIDTPDGRLVDGSLAVFKLNGAGTILSLNTHKPYNTAKGAIPEGMGGGIYEVYVRMPGGTEFFVGMFTVIAPVIIPAQPSISPTSGTSGDQFIIYDPLGRMATAQWIVFTPEGDSPDNGARVTDAHFSADGKTATGLVPDLALGGRNFVTVHQTSVTEPPIFNGLLFDLR